MSTLKRRNHLRKITNSLYLRFANRAIRFSSKSFELPVNFKSDNLKNITKQMILIGHPGPLSKTVIALAMHQHKSAQIISMEMDPDHLIEQFARLAQPKIDTEQLIREFTKLSTISREHEVIETLKKPLHPKHQNRNQRFHK